MIDDVWKRDSKYGYSETAFLSSATPNGPKMLILFAFAHVFVTVLKGHHEPLGFDFLIGFRKILNWAILSLSCFYFAGFARNGADKKTSCPIWCDDPTAGVSLTVGPPVSHNAFNVGSDHGQDRKLPCPLVSKKTWRHGNPRTSELEIWENQEGMNEIWAVFLTESEKHPHDSQKPLTTWQQELI